MNEVYDFDGLRFWANRALRLLPPYYLVCLLTLAAIALAPAQASDYLKFWRGVPSLDDLLANASVLPLQLTYTSFRLIPPYWSVAIEIDMYLMLFLVTSRRMEWALLTLVAGLTVQLVSFYDFAGWGFNYFTAPAGVLPFAIGAVLYFLRRRGLWTATPRAAAIAFVFWLGNMLAGGSLLPQSYVSGAGYFLDTICFTITASGLSGLSKDSFGPLIRRIDRTLGEWSYFAFLVHWLCGFVVVSTVLGGEQRGWLLLAAVTPLVLVACAGFAALNRRCLEPLRDWVRSGFGRRSAPAPVALASEPR